MSSRALVIGSVLLVVITFVVMITQIRQSTKVSPKTGARFMPEASTSQQSDRQLKWGAYAGDHVEDVRVLEDKVGRDMGYVATFVHWGNNSAFPAQLAETVKAKGQTLVIFWEAMDYNQKDPDDSRFAYDSILAGQWDAYIDEFGNSIQNSNVPVLVIPFEEMNSDWYPWSLTINGNTAAKHVAAYRYIRAKWQGISNLQMGWVINHRSVPDDSNNIFIDAYPGNEYVDIIGINGFNFGDPWKSFDELFEPSLTTLKTFGKPILITSFASAAGPRKAAWITAAGQKIHSDPGIIGFIWFNEDKERDWRIWSDESSLTSFKRLLEVIDESSRRPD